MTDIEPYEYQRKTNIKEHNDIVGKINEIVNVINNNDLENIGPKIEGITKTLLSDVVLMNGTTVGNMKVRIERKDTPSIDSNDYNIQKPTSVELVQGSAPAMIKAQITLSDGTVLISDDFMFTTEAIGQDVYISSFVFKNGNVAGTISADIGLSNGTTLTANNFAVPTDPNVTFAISDLNTRVSAIEGGSGLNELKAAVADLQTNKADVDNRNQIIKTKVIDAYSMTLEPETTSIVNPESCTFVTRERESGKVDTTKPINVIRNYYDDFIGDYTSDSIGYMALLDSDGNPKNFTAGGSTVIPCPLNYVEFFNSLQLGSEIYGDRLDFNNNDTDIIASFYNFNFKCVTNNSTDGIYIIGQAYKTQMVLGNNTTLYRNSVTIVFKSGKVTITVEGGTNETASSSIVVKRSQFPPMSTINTNVFIRV